MGSFQIEAGCDGLFTTSVPRGWENYRWRVTPTHGTLLTSFRTTGLPRLDSHLRCSASNVFLGQPINGALLASTQMARALSGTYEAK